MKTNRRSGFTLIELMVVVIIIAALAGMVLPRLIPTADEAKRKICEGEIANIGVALKLYRLEKNAYPKTVDELYPTYLEKSPRDPWDQPYQFTQPGEKNTLSFDLWSIGPNGKNEKGEGDDVKNWDSNTAK